MKNYLLLASIAFIFSCSKKPTRFELLPSNHTGVAFVNEVIASDSLHVMNFEYIYNGAGVGIVDLNNDNLQDIVFTGNQVATKIYLNEGNFKFSDISSGLVGQDSSQWNSGVSIVDINSDGWVDLYITCTAYEEAEKRKNWLWINKGIQANGELVFEEQAEAYGIADESYGVHAAFFDYDLDGDLDLYLLNNFVTERLSASYREKITDGSAISNDKLYRNDGDGTFSDVTLDAGIVYEGFGLGLAMGDVNRDGYPDVYVSNDYISNDLLYINQGDGTFKNEIATYLSYQTKSSMGNDMADINNDGYPEIFTLDMMPEYYYKKKQTINGFGYIYYFNDEKFGYEHQYLRNMLHMHNGLLDGAMIPYSEVGQMLGIYQTEWSWSPLFADYDNDGDKDLLITNGYPRDLTDKDWTKYKAQVYGFVADAQHVMNKAPAIKATNFAFENDGELSFVKKSDEWFAEEPSYSYGASFADLDNDGDLDYVVNNLNDKAFIYKNNTIEAGKENLNYIRIKLIGKDPNTMAFGAKIEVWCGENYQYLENFLSRGYISSVDPIAHFGVQNSTLIDSVKITWPATDKTTTIAEIQPNQMLEINQNNSMPKHSLPKTDEHRYFFTKSVVGLDYTHQQENYIDFALSQNIIPHKFSQIGPKMAKGDIDRDGYDDIIIGATNVLPTKVYLRKENGFQEAQFEGLTTKKEFSEADIAILDYDGDGDHDVIALAGGYENMKEEEYKHYIYKNEGGIFTREELPIDPFSASVVKPCDFDRDGDIDLFIGSRVKKEMFPLGAESWILINDKGNYTKENSLNFNLGMVTDAVWSDYDGDGWKDLMITREWNSISIIKNVEGERFVSQELPEIEKKHGIWYSIVAGDFDKDGDDDYIIGNLGNNHRYTISDNYPLRIYAIDLDLNGTLDPLSTGYWMDSTDVMREYPINYLDELIGQSGYFRKKFHDYTPFSFATIDAFITPDMKERVLYTFWVNTSSSYMLLNDNGNFIWHELPKEAQVAPIKKMIVQDFNDDTFPDVILAGNDHTYDVSTGYYDANKGLILLSEDGKPLSDLKVPSQTGLVLHGMVESLLYLDGKNPLLIAGYNRDTVEAFRINK